MQTVDFTDEDATKFRAAMRDPELRRQLYEETRLKSEANARRLPKRKMESENATLLDEEEMEILKRSKEEEKEDDYLKEFDYGGKAKRKTRRNNKKHTKKHYKKSKSKSKMYKRHRTQRRHKTRGKH